MYYLTVFDFRNKLENDARKQGAKVLDEVPKDLKQFDMEKLVLLSQPKDFRKLKYLFALLTGRFEVFWIESFFSAYSVFLQESRFFIISG